MAESFGLFKAAKDSAAALLVTLQEVPDYLRSWKESSARHGARMVLSAIKAAYKEVDVTFCSKGLAASNNHGKENDLAALWTALAGYDQSIVELCNLDQRLDAEPCPPSPQAPEGETSEEGESTNSSSEHEEEEQEDEEPKSPAADQ